MDDHFLMLDQLPHWRAILTFYLQNQPVPEKTPKPAEASVDSNDQQLEPTTKPWVNRVTQLEGIEPEELSWLHGQLIALGYLEFDLMSRSDGIGYLISRQGKRALNRPEISETKTESSDVA